MKLTLDILICTRNRKRELFNCVESLFLLDLKPQRLLIVDSSTKPLSQQELKSLRKRSPFEINYVKVKHKNIAYSRNIGLRSVSASVCAFIDDDAVADQHWTKNIIKTFKETSAVGIGGHVEALDQNYFSRCGAFIYSKNLETKKNSRELEAFAGVNSAFKIDFLKKHHIRFNESNSTGEDIIFCYEIRNKGGKLLYAPQAKVRHKFRTSLKSFFTRYWEYALDEYKYWQIFPNLSGLFLFVPNRLLHKILWPFFIIWNFTRRLLHYCDTVESLKYIPGVSIHLLAFFIGIYFCYIKEALAKSK